jgi:choline dehydrogenase-like flavoprotein
VFLDGRGVDDGSELDADVCVVGAGPAGITIARELDGRDLRVVVLESGGFTIDAATQDLARGEIAGHAYPSLESSRLRVFGGTTAHWNGWCRPLDAVDFELRPTVPHSGWPIGLRDLEPYYEPAQSLCELGPFEYDGAHWARTHGARPLPLTGGGFETSVFQFSPPTRFGEAYRERLRTSGNVRVLLHSNATAIVQADGGRRVDRVRVATLTGRRFAVRARRYVLACGGIENARLLLASNVANDTPVGRFFAEHPHSPVAVAVLPSDVATLYLRAVSGGSARVRAALATSEALARDLLRASMTLEPLAADPYIDHNDARERRIAALSRDVASVATSLEGSRFAVYALYMRTEQAPNPSSRVALADERDALGVPRARLEWRLSELDRRSTAQTVELFAQTLGRLGVGRLYSRPGADVGFWDRVGGGFHHVGTTRMGTDPRASVVDGDCRVHGIANLYVAGSSTFPTSGYANPTLTIVALALRLAQTLKESPA